MSDIILNADVMKGAGSFVTKIALASLTLRRNFERTEMSQYVQLLQLHYRKLSSAMHTPGIDRILCGAFMVFSFEISLT